MKEKLQRFMMGRYGVDSFSRCLLWLSIISIVIYMLTGYKFMNLIAIALIVYLYYRILSRNYQKRYAENLLFLNKTAPIRRFINNKKTHFRQRKTHKFFKCPNCKQDIRIPRGQGKIRITCPKCKTEFKRET